MPVPVSFVLEKRVRLPEVGGGGGGMEGLLERLMGGVARFPRP